MSIVGAQEIVLHTADLATTILAIVGVFLSLVALGWQAVSFWLSGSRVSVEIRAGATDGVRAITMAGQPTESQTASLYKQGLTQKVLAVEVINSGRAPTSVMSVDVLYPNGAVLTGSYLLGSPQLPCRMEAESERTWYVDADLAARTARAFEEDRKTGRPWAVRGQAKLGGKKTVASKKDIRVF